MLRPSLLLVLILLVSWSGSLVSIIIHKSKHTHRFPTQFSMTVTPPDQDLHRTNSIPAVMDFIQLTCQLKTTLRTGWVLRGVPRAESVADHSWHVALLSLLVLPFEPRSSLEEAPREPLDVLKCIQMALIHDLAECIVGDITPCDTKVRTKEEKQKLEQDAILHLASLLERVQGQDEDDNKNSSLGIIPTWNPKEKLLELFHEYEQRSTPEAIAVKDLDMLDLIIQANEYEKMHEKNHFSLEEFFVNTPPDRFQTDIVKRYAEEVHRRRKCRWDEKRMKENSSGWSDPHDGHWQDTIALTKEDEEFVSDFAATATDLKLEDIRSVVQSLRAKDRVLGRG